MFRLLIILFLWPLVGLSQLPTYVPTQGLQTWYSFNGNILDYSGNGHNNANYNISTTTDRFNNILSALYFSGTGTEYLNYGDVDDFEPYIFSISFWINPEDFGSNTSQQIKPIVSKWSSVSDLNNSSYNIYLNGMDLCFLITDGVTIDTLRASTSHLQLNQWSHIVITSNYGFIKIYIDNVLVTDAMSAISSLNNTTSEFKVGGWYQDIDANFSSFTGKIDDLGIWDLELSSCEVDALFSGSACNSLGMPELEKGEKELIKILDLTGREVSFQKNKVLIYMYSDGTTERVFFYE